MKSLKFFRSWQKKKKKLVLSFSVPKVSALNFGARFSVRSCFSLSRQNTMITLTRCVRNTKIGPRQSEAEEEKGRAFSVNHLFCSRPLDLVKKQPKRFASFFASPEISRIASSALDKVSSRDRERVSIKRKKSHLASHEEKKKKLDKKKAIDPIETKKTARAAAKALPSSPAAAAAEEPGQASSLSQLLPPSAAAGSSLHFCLCLRAEQEQSPPLLLLLLRGRPLRQQPGEGGGQQREKEGARFRLPRPPPSPAPSRARLSPSSWRRSS